MIRTGLAGFADSLGRCLANPDFLTRFYELFGASSEEVAEKLRGIDLERQKRALAASLYVIVMALEGGDTATMYLDQVARRHGREDLDIRPELYDAWLDCLVQAVREYDPQYNTVVEQMWRGVMREAIKQMTARY